MSVYLDYQSAKPVDPRVLKAMSPHFSDEFGNPSSLHREGDRATETLLECRAGVARFISARPEEVVFTSGATESNNLALIGFVQRNRMKGNHVIVSEIEHISIHNIAKYLEKDGCRVSKVPVDQEGTIRLDRLAEQMSEETLLVSVGHASNEVGTMQPIAEIGKLCRDRGIAFHSDAVAAEGLVPLDVEKGNLDLLSISSNDIYGPPGVGALYIRTGVKIRPLLIGGGQEKGLRSGTENMPGIVGMKEAARIARREMDEESGRLARYRDRLINRILEGVPRCYLNGHRTRRLANNAHFRFDGIEGESLLLLLKDEGISVSTGSACSSKTLEPSHTLLSLGLLHEEAHGSLQLTCGRFTKDEDVDRVLECLPGAVQRLRELSPLYEEGG